MAAGNLKDVKIRNIKAGSNAVAHGGVGGLMFEPSTSKKGVGSWVLSFTFQGKRQRITLGSYPEMSIEQAAKKAIEQKELAKQGINPKEEAERLKHARKLEADNTLERVGRAYFEQAKLSGKWRSEAAETRNIRRLERYIFPLLGGKAINAITAADIVNTLRTPIQEKTNGKQTVVSLKNSKGVAIDSRDTSDKICGLLNQIFQYAELMGLRTVGNPIPAVRQGLNSMQGNKAEEHYPSMPVENVPLFVAELLKDGIDSLTVGKAALICQILTGARSGAIRGMEFADVDLDKKVLTIPAFRAGAKTDNDICYPITPAFEKILISMWEKSSKAGRLVFCTRKIGAGDKAISEATMLRAMQGISLEHPELTASDVAGRIAVPHGFRSTFMGWAIQQGYDDRLIERQLAHVVGGKVRQAYDREKLTEERREMMTAWENYCLGKLENTND